MKFIVVSAYLLVCLSVNGTNYHFSSSTGNDGRSAVEAQNPATPWKSLEKLNASFSIFQPGDNIYFKRGDVFYGTVVATRSGNAGSPITFSAYGVGNQPILSGFTKLSGWQQTGHNVYEVQNAQINGSVKMLLMNGYAKALGRYPNTGAANGGYLMFESAIGNTSVTDSKLSAFNFSNGEIVIRKNRWVLDRNKINSHVGSTISYASQSGYKADAGYGYFIQNHPTTLDQDGEWYVKAGDKKIGIYSSAGIASLANIEVATVDMLVQLQNVNHLRFENLVLQGSNKNAFYLKNTQQVQVNNCTIINNGANAFTADNTNGLIVKDCLIENSYNIGFNGLACSNTIISQNTIRYSGATAGMGDGNSGSYEGIMITGNNNTIEKNTIENTGYIPVTFSGDNYTINNNFIKDYAFVKDDGGAIYTWNNGSNAVENRNRVITGNVILNGSGAAAGTDKNDRFFAHGIYIDDNATDVKIDGNTIAHCKGFGIYIHNARNLSITNNTSYNNMVQLEMAHDDIAPNSRVINNTVTGNIFFSLQADQPVAEYKTRLDELGSFGTIDRNYYSRPANENATINTLKKINGTYVFQTLDLDGWKQLYGKDASSQVSPKAIAPFSITQFNSNNLFSNGAFNSNIAGLYSYSPANNCTTSWSNGTLDGGSLQVAFSTQAGNNNKGSVIIGVGSIKAGQPYILRFSYKGALEHKMLEVYLRKSQAPYNDMTDRQLLKIDPLRKEATLLFVPTESQSAASIGIDVPEQKGPFYIDNIQLNEAAVILSNIKDSVAFQYNATLLTKAFSLPGNFIDVKNNAFSNTITLNPFSSAVLIKANGTVLNSAVAVSCAATGTILREQWSNVGGTNLGANNWANNPTITGQLNLFEGPANSGDNYASRISGYICPPISGNYTFWIAGDDESALYLSTNDDPGNKVRIAYGLSWSSSREWNKHATQKSATIALEAGKKYYIEAVQKEGGGGDNLAVAWQLPNGVLEAPIPGNRLSPATGLPPAVALLSQSITFAPVSELLLGVAPVALQATASSGLPVTLKVVSGPGTLLANQLAISGVGTVVIEASQAGSAQYTAAPLVTRTISITAPNQCSASGTILWEYWSNTGGNTVASHDWNKAPTASKQLSIFEGPTNTADSYASRFRGYVCPPQNGAYTFWIAGDDATELYLSTDANPANKQKIAYNVSWVGVRDWNKTVTQKSIPITLEAGKRYYIEALHKEGAGGDNLAVGWQLPGGTLERPLPANRLSPFNGTVAGKLAARAASPAGVVIINAPTLTVYPNPISSRAIISFQSPYQTKASIELKDVQGRKVQTIFSGTLDATAVKKLTFDSSDIASGVYVLQFITEQKRESIQLIIQK